MTGPGRFSTCKGIPYGRIVSYPSHSHIVLLTVHYQKKNIITNTSQASPVSTTAIAQWSPYTALTSSWQPTSDVLRAYFTGTNKFTYQLSGTNASSADFAAITRGDLAQNSTSGISTAGWSTPFHDLSWIPSEAVGAGISSLAWLDEVRLYRIVAGQLTESRLIANIWSAQFI